MLVREVDFSCAKDNIEKTKNMLGVVKGCCVYCRDQ